MTLVEAFMTDFQSGALSLPDALERAGALGREEILEYYALRVGSTELDPSDLTDQLFDMLEEETAFDILLYPPGEAVPISDDQDRLFTDSLHLFYWRIVVSGRSEQMRWWSKSDDWLLRKVFLPRLFVPIEVLDAAGSTRTIKVFAFTADERLVVTHNARAFYFGSPSDGDTGFLHSPSPPPNDEPALSEKRLDAERFEAVTIFPNLQASELSTYRLLEPILVLSPRESEEKENALAVALNAFLDEAARVALEKAKQGVAAGIGASTGTGKLGSAFVTFLLDQLIKKFKELEFDEDKQLVIRMPTLRFGGRASDLVPIDSLARPGAANAKRGTGPELWAWGAHEESQLLRESLLNAKAFHRDARPTTTTVDFRYYVESRFIIRRSASSAQ